MMFECFGVRGERNDIQKAGTKRDLQNGNFRSYQVGNHVFGAQTIEMNEMTCCDEKPLTLCEDDKKSSQNHENHVLSTLEAI